MGNAVHFLKIQLSFYTHLTQKNKYIHECVCFVFVFVLVFLGGFFGGEGGGVLMDIHQWQANLHPLKFYRTSHHQMSHKLTSSFLLI